MGDIFSSKKTETTNVVTNQQVAVQGRDAAIALGAHAVGNHSVVNFDITTGDVEDLAATKAIALAAIHGIGDAATGSSLVAIESIRSNQENSNKALDVADRVATSSLATVYQTLSNWSKYQEQSNALIGSAVGVAENIALNAAPVSPGAYAEATQANNLSSQKQVVYAIVAIVTLVSLVYYLKK